MKDEDTMKNFLKGLSKAKEPPLHQAVTEGTTETIKILIAEGADVNAKDKDGNTPLHTAAIVDQVEAMKILIDQGANVNTRNKYSFTPLDQALIREAIKNLNSTPSQAEMVKILINAGADINTKDGDGDTALSKAIGLTSIEVIKALINAGADVNAKVEVKTDDGRINRDAPLHCAVSSGKPEAIKALIDAGADINAKDGTESLTPLNKAIAFLLDAIKLQDIETIKSLAESIKILIASGADVLPDNHSNLDFFLYISFLQADFELKSLGEVSGLLIEAQGEFLKASLLQNPIEKL